MKPPRNLGVGTKTVMPRRSASARSGRCGESGLTLMAVALFHGSMSRSRAAATSAPAKFGIRPCDGNGKRATPSALSLSQTHCRAALLSAKSRAMTESGAARPGDSQGHNLLQKHLGEILASQTSQPSTEKPCSMGRPSRRPTAIQAALRRRRAGDVWLGRCSKVRLASSIADIDLWGSPGSLKNHSHSCHGKWLRTKNPRPLTQQCNR